MDPVDIVDTGAPANDIPTTVVDTPEAPESRRDVLSAAFDEAVDDAGNEKPEYLAKGTEKPVVEPTTKIPEAKAPLDLGKPPKDAKPSVVGTDKSELAPASWKPDAKSKWGTVDPAIRQEVLRRERETAQIVSSSDQARRFTHAMGQVIGPHQARLQSLGVEPDVAVKLLLQSDAILSQGAPAARAAKMAKMITDYGVDIDLLDAALRGAQLPQEEVQANNLEQRIMQRIDQRLAPVQEREQQRQQVNQRNQDQQTQQLMSEVDAMEANIEKFPYFQQVRGDMADIIEFSAKKGIYLTTEQAYNKACGLNDDIATKVASDRKLASDRVAASARDARARKSLGASRSIAGSANGAPTAYVPPASDRRGTIAAAFDAHDGR